MQGRHRSRRLRAEMLERRDLLAGDAGFAIEMNFSHNFVHPEDVDQSNSVTPFDAMAVVAAMRAGESEAGNGKHFPDVNGDNKLTVFDPFLVLGAVRAQLEQSQAPLENRIARLQEALSAGVLPENLDVAEAEQILETLENGGRPELGEEILPSQFEELRESREWDLANELLAALEAEGIDTARARDWIQDIRGLLPDSEQPIQDLVGQILNGDRGLANEIVVTIEENIGDESGEVSRWVEQISEYLPDDETPLRDLFEQFRSDNIDEFTAELLAALEAEGVDTATAQEWINDFRNLLPAESETPWIDLLGRLRSEPENLTDDILAILSENGVNTDEAERWVDDLSELLPESETPWRDLVDQIRNDGPGPFAQQLLAILEANGVNTADADAWINDIVALLPDSETPIQDALEELQGENGEAFLEEILGVLENNGVDTSAARGWINDILALLPDSETPLADFLAGLEGEGLDAGIADILALLNARGVDTDPALPWIDLAKQFLEDGDGLESTLPIDIAVTEGEWFDIDWQFYEFKDHGLFSESRWFG